MSLLRHHALLFEQNEFLPAPIVGPVLRIRPSDGDDLNDRRQRWWVLLDVARQEVGIVDAIVSTSFDGLLWYPVATLSTKRSPALVEFVPLTAFAPLLRMQTSGGDVLPAHRLIARLASDGPFTAVPG